MIVKTSLVYLAECVEKSRVMNVLRVLITIKEADLTALIVLTFIYLGGVYLNTLTLWGGG